MHFVDPVRAILQKRLPIRIGRRRRAALGAIVQILIRPEVRDLIRLTSIGLPNAYIF
jgi:hypothetical protein